MANGKLYFPQIRTKNYTTKPLRKKGILGFYPNRVLIRFGSLTESKQVFINKNIDNLIEINTVEAIQNSRSKLRMKECFKTLNIPQSSWWDSLQALSQTTEIPYPILAKRVFGFQGRGMTKIDNQQQLDKFLSNHSNLEGWYFEEFKNFSREYRLHVTQEECFMAWRKLRKSDATERWYFNSHNCNWVSEEHELFNKPINWNSIVEEAIKAARATGLDIGAVDVRVQSSTDNKGQPRINPEFIVLEINSAPALGEAGINAYAEILKKLIINKKYPNDK